MCGSYVWGRTYEIKGVRFGMCSVGCVGYMWYVYLVCGVFMCVVYTCDTKV